MSNWFRIPCETCGETGKICEICDGSGETDCNCDDGDNCSLCSGSGVVECADCLQCPDCDGQGYREIFVDNCFECGGDGTVECDCTGGLGTDAADEDCIACGGSGTHTCPACKGSGYDLDALSDREKDIVLFG